MDIWKHRLKNMKAAHEFHRDALKSWMHFLSTKLGKGWLEDSVLNKMVERRKPCHRQTVSPRAMHWCKKVNRGRAGQWHFNNIFFLIKEYNPIYILSLFIISASFCISISSFFFSPFFYKLNVNCWKSHHCPTSLVSQCHMRGCLAHHLFISEVLRRQRKETFIHQF